MELFPSFSYTSISIIESCFLFSNLIKLCSKKIERSDDASVWSESVLLHHLLVVHSVPDVNVGWVGNLIASRIEVHYIGGPLPGPGEN